MSTSDMKVYVVETVSVFRKTYYVKALSAEHANDEVVCAMHTDALIEGSQHHVTEDISFTREVTEREFLNIFDQENPHSRDLSRKEKMEHINVIDYVSGF